MTAVQLSSTQQEFAAELGKDTGLNPAVLEAWLRNEEPAESTNGALGAYNFLNVGITDNGRYGEANSVWANPKTAADATAAWMKGQPIGPGGYSSTGYPGASSGIQSILGSAGQGPPAQIKAIQGSGWASGGETALPSLYSEITGQGLATIPGVTPPGLTAAAAATASSPSGSSSSGGSSGSCGATLQPGGYISTNGGGILNGIIGSLNPFNAVASVWDAILGDAKYAGLFLLILIVGGFLIMKGISTNGGPSPKMPTFIPVPV